MSISEITLPQKDIITFCKKHHIHSLYFFGSVLRQDFSHDSDIDVLVEFKEGYTPGLAFFAMQEELSVMLGRKVDLATPKFLSRYFRDKVIAEAKVQYIHE